MHELGITRNIVGIACEHADGKRVKKIVLRIGVHSGLATEAIAFCFDVVAKGTLCEGATLEIQSVEGKAHCRACDQPFALPTLSSACVCGKRNFAIVAGEELKIYQIETEA